MTAHVSPGSPTRPTHGTAVRTISALGAVTFATLAGFVIYYAVGMIVGPFVQTSSDTLATLLVLVVALPSVLIPVGITTRKIWNARLVTDKGLLAFSVSGGVVLGFGLLIALIDVLFRMA